MINTLKSFSHAGESHQDTVSGLGHYLDYSLVAFLVWLAVIAIIHAASARNSKIATSTELLLVATFSLVYGVFLYNKSPGVGALAVGAGFGVTLFTVMLGLQGSNPPVKKRGASGRRKK